MSNVKKSNTLTIEVHQKKKFQSNLSVTIICDIKFDLRVCKSHYIEVIPHQVPTKFKVIC